MTTRRTFLIGAGATGALGLTGSFAWPQLAAAAPTISPLTGLSSENGSRASLIIKVDNHPNARPQIGLNYADVVVEELVEGMSRFAAVFQTTDPDRVGPVRSARVSDVIFFNGWNSPLIAYSGANKKTDIAVDRSRLVNVNQTKAPGAYSKIPKRSSPHNLQVWPQAVRFAGGQRPGATPAMFTFRPAGEVPKDSLKVNGVAVTFDSTTAEFRWDGSGWVRSQATGKAKMTPHKTADGVQLAPANVVILFTEYVKSPADTRTPQANTVGEGEAWVFSGGTLVQGRWKRPDQFKPGQLVRADGRAITLAPGQTFIELPRPGSARLL
jgi:hypothetical protein